MALWFFTLSTHFGIQGLRKEALLYTLRILESTHLFIQHTFIRTCDQGWDHNDGQGWINCEGNQKPSKPRLGWFISLSAQTGLRRRRGLDRSIWFLIIQSLKSK